MLSLFSNRTYTCLYSAQVIALFGTGLTTVALSLLAYEIAGSGAGIILGTALALKMVAYVTIAPIAGAFAHKVPRRALLVGLDIARATVILCLPFVDAVWQIYVLIFLTNACSAAFTPLFQAVIPDLFQDETTYTRALSLSRLAYDLEKLLSPSAAALALLFISYDGLFIANAAAFIASALLVVSTRLPTTRHPERTEGLIATLTFGIRAYLSTPRLRGLLALSLAVAAAGSMVIVNTVVVAQDVLGGSGSLTAVAFATSGAGSMIAALLLPRVLDSRSDREVMLWGGAALVAGLLAGLMKPGLIAVLTIWFVLGAASAVIQTPAGRLLHRSSSDGDRAAFFSAQFALSHLCWLITYPLAGWTSAIFGLSAAFATLAGVCGIAVLAATRLWPANDPIVLEHQHDEIVHDHKHVHDQHHQHDHQGWEGPEPHSHRHSHARLRHTHAFVIDLHHPAWPRG